LDLFRLRRGTLTRLNYPGSSVEPVYLGFNGFDFISILFNLFVLTSLNEGISNTIFEAMATGLPAVVTSVGGNPELVKDGITGTLVG
jgi:glycosyltransferase involved in cell wall biosynthesis